MLTEMAEERYELERSQSEETMDFRKLKAKGESLADGICLAFYLRRHEVGVDATSDLFRHMGYISSGGKRSDESYRKIAEMEKGFGMRKGVLRGLVDVALGKYPEIAKA